MIELTFPWISIFILSFYIMEFNAWALHKYAMHGPLWFLHRGHHLGAKKYGLQLNDLFALFFATPSFLSILFSALYRIPSLGAVGFGIMLYGFAYFFIHDVVIHQRIRFTLFSNIFYIKTLIKAHHDHHTTITKKNAKNFGMLLVPFKYFRHNTCK